MPDSVSNRPLPMSLSSRYSRQILFPEIGTAGQEKLRAARVTLVGCGALGTVLANTLVRAGVGFVRIIDRDYVELNNLQRQVLFNESDVAQGMPKAVAAAAHLAAVNSEVTIEPVVADVTASNIEALVEDVQLILDGTDNFETRYLINDVAVKRRIPWVYGACVGSDGMVMPILPHETPCLRCVFDRPPPPGVSPTCDTAGVLGSIVNIVASLQAVEALKILMGRLDAVNRHLLQIDAWTGRFDSFDMQAALEGDCPCCKRGQYDFLTGQSTWRAAALCGRDAVQVTPPPESHVDFDAVADRIVKVAHGTPQRNRYLLRFEVDDKQVTLFRDGRAIIKGTSEPDEARTLYAKYIGV